ncbi:MAG: hypothetical protein HYX69_21050 [Planctomycetia bacterium]|nr:hypothetical protein [Planctomycetia bacterium]
MSKAKSRHNPQKKRYDRAIFTLPPDLLADVRKYARAYHEGNNSGFVAAALRSYIDYLAKVRHTARLRESYAAAANAGRKVAADWDAASDARWQKLDPPSRRGRTK